MKTLIFVALLAVILTSIVPASAGPLYTLDYFPEYVGGVSGNTFFPGVVFQASATFPLDKYGTYTGLWASYSPEGGFNSDFGDELDVYVGKCFTAGSIKADIGVNYYDLIPIETSKGDLVALYGNFSPAKCDGWVPTLHVEYDFSTNRTFCLSGLMASLAFSRQIGKSEVSITLGSHPYAFGCDAEPISYVALKWVVPVGEKMHLSVRAQKATGHANGMADDVITIGGGLCF